MKRLFFCILSIFSLLLINPYVNVNAATYQCDECGYSGASQTHTKKCGDFVFDHYECSTCNKNFENKNFHLKNCENKLEFYGYHCELHKDVILTESTHTAICKNNILNCNSASSTAYTVSSVKGNISLPITNFIDTNTTSTPAYRCKALINGKYIKKYTCKTCGFVYHTVDIYAPFTVVDQYNMGPISVTINDGNNTHKLLEGQEYYLDSYFYDQLYKKQFIENNECFIGVDGNESYYWEHSTCFQKHYHPDKKNLTQCPSEYICNKAQRQYKCFYCESEYTYTEAKNYNFTCFKTVLCNANFTPILKCSNCSTLQKTSNANTHIITCSHDAIKKETENKPQNETKKTTTIISSGRKTNTNYAFYTRFTKKYALIQFKKNVSVKKIQVQISNTKKYKKKKTYTFSTNKAKKYNKKKLSSKTIALYQTKNKHYIAIGKKYTKKYWGKKKYIRVRFVDNINQKSKWFSLS